MIATIFLDQPGASAKADPAHPQVHVQGGSTVFDPRVTLAFPATTPPGHIAAIADAINAAIAGARAESERRLKLARAL